jgi:phenylacetate-CoA ligase
MTVRLFSDLPRILYQPWLKREELEALQQVKLRKVIRHAYENVPYYRELFDSRGIQPEDIQTSGDLDRLPITTRAVLQSFPVTEITARNVDLNRCVRTQTSGSQGIPLGIYYRKEDKDYLDVVWARAKLANGQRLIDRVVSIRESTDAPPPRHWYNYFGIWKTTYVSGSLEPEKQLDLMESVNPQIISGYPSNLKLLSQELQGRKERTLKPRAVFTMAELLDVSSRNWISSVFKAPLFDFYGSTELGLVGWECSARTGYHINIDSVIVEYIWDGKPVMPGQEGKLVCTALNSYAMPFIRYEIGDVGIQWDKPCPCGRKLPLLKVIEGRFNDFIVIKDGKRISPFELTCAVESIPGIAKYQIVQEKMDRVVVRLVRGREFSQAVFGEIRQKLRPLWGEGVEVLFEVLEDIPKGNSKYQVVLSKVKDCR